MFNSYITDDFPIYLVFKATSTIPIIIKRHGQSLAVHKKNIYCWLWMVIFHVCFQTTKGLTHSPSFRTPSLDATGKPVGHDGAWGLLEDLNVLIFSAFRRPRSAYVGKCSQEALPSTVSRNCAKKIFLLNNLILLLRCVVSTAVE